MIDEEAVEGTDVEEKRNAQEHSRLQWLSGVLTDQQVPEVGQGSDKAGQQAQDQAVPEGSQDNHREEENEDVRPGPRGERQSHTDDDCVRGNDP